MLDPGTLPGAVVASVIAGALLLMAEYIVRQLWMKRRSETDFTNLKHYNTSKPIPRIFATLWDFLKGLGSVFTLHDEPDAIEGFIGLVGAVACAVYGHSIGGPVVAVLGFTVGGTIALRFPDLS